MATAAEKEVLRRKFLQLRDALTPEERHSKDALIRERFLSSDGFMRASTVFFYCSKGSEVDTRILIEEALAKGKRVVLPQTLENKGLMARQIQHLEEDGRPGAFGIWEPKLSMPAVSQSEIDLFVIPGAAFDLSGVRLGWGKGYFDQYLAGIGQPSMKAALAYEVQVCPALPVQKHDVCMNVLITEKRVLTFGEMTPKLKMEK
jgi:5-formyltetrahydrofolate cyclo-ligase